MRWVACFWTGCWCVSSLGSSRTRPRSDEQENDYQQAIGDDVTLFFFSSFLFLLNLDNDQQTLSKPPPSPLQGAAVIAAPQHQMTIAAGAAAVQGVRALAGAARERNQRKQREQEEASEESDSSVSPSPVSSAAPSRNPSASALAPSAASDPANVNVTQPVDLLWSDLSVFVPDKAAAAAAVASGTMNERAAAKKLKKSILYKVSGVAAAGRLVAIMGPSGGGKTTLLHALAGQLAKAPGLEATGSVVALVPVAATKVETATTTAAAQKKRTPTRSPPRVAFVQQSDEFFSMLTVRETLELAARLRAKQDTPEAEISATAEALMRRLGLAKVADARVGGGRARGLSGGERKRLSIACELVGSPAVLFADEPTSGLDSFQAERVVSALSDLAKNDGRTVVASIHQPRSSAFALFDDLVLLAEGKVAYSGPAAEALSHFASEEGGGHRCPSHFNPAEFLADLVSVDHSSPEAEEASRERVRGITDAWAAKQETERLNGGGGGGGVGGELFKSPRHSHSHHHHGSRTSFPTQLSLLGKRAWRQTTRDGATACARAASSLSSALIFGSIYWRLGKGQASIQDRMGLLQVSAINAAMSALVKTLSAFPRVSVCLFSVSSGFFGTVLFFFSLSPSLPLPLSLSLSPSPSLPLSLSLSPSLSFSILPFLSKKNIVEQERQIVERERTSSGDGGYPVLPYFLAKLSAEAPLGAAFPLLFGAAVYPSAGLNPSPLRFAKFCGVLSLEALTSTAMGLAVGAAAPNADAAMAIGPAVTVIFIVFGGVCVFLVVVFFDFGFRLSFFTLSLSHALFSFSLRPPPPTPHTHTHEKT